MRFFAARCMTSMPVCDGAREEHLRDAGVLDEDVRVGAAGRHDVHDAGRETRPAAEVPDREARQSGGGRGLQDDRVARREAGRDLDERDAERKVPGRHDRDDAERLEAVAALFVREEDLRVVDGRSARAHPRGARQIAERVGGRARCRRRAPRRRAFPARSRRGARRRRARGALPRGGARGDAAGPRRAFSTTRERLPRRGDGHVDLVRAGPEHFRERLGRGGVHRRERHAGPHVLTVDDRRVRERERRPQIIAPRLIVSFFVRQNATSLWT